MSTLLRFEQGPCPADVSFLLPPTRGISIISHQLPRTSGYCNPLRRFVVDCLEPLFIVFFFGSEPQSECFVFAMRFALLVSASRQHLRNLQVSTGGTVPR